ncbi:MAG: lipoyl synthase, partial [Actinomycetia bacterium]|nr:lipoyl synthase [Actinomycetes bacterium]
CPNIGECFFNKKLTFLILGDICTRNCSFCNVKTGVPEEMDSDEPKRIASVVKELKLEYVVITSVTRDDLADGGCSVFLEVIEQLKQLNQEIKIEVLIPDFKEDRESLKKIALSDVDVIGHNIETIERLYPEIRPMADFNNSLNVLRYIKETAPSQKKIKSGFMVGFGEDIEEIKKLLHILFTQHVDIVTVGQYFQPSLINVPVKRIYTDEEFNEIKDSGKRTGFKYISSGRFVRSSYYAEDVSN